MEVIPCSGVQYVGEADCTQQSTGSSFVYDGDSKCYEHEKQVQTADGKMDNLLLNTQALPEERQGEKEVTGHELYNSGGNQCGASDCDDQVERRRSSPHSHNFEEDEVNMQCDSSMPCLSSHLVVDTIESESLSNNREGELSLTEPSWLRSDEPVALWVKWRGKWQVGIRCARADWPLSTLKAKPTHDRKKYFVIFFPHTRNYSWADMLLVRSINELPEPIAYRTHKIGLKMVKDLTVARRYIMQKLAVGMLNIIDQFHLEALIETARDVIVWKEFAMEASRCNGYFDLGRMLLKLQSMILQHFINSDWLEHSSHSWVQQCQNAHSAESIELLKEELFDSILWNEVKSLWDAPIQPTLGSEWKTWKHEVMKWFSTSHPPSSGDMEPQNSDSFSNPGLQVNTKRPKLEVRRAEAHGTHLESDGSRQAITVEIDSDFFRFRETTNIVQLVQEIHKEADLMEANVKTGAPNGGTNSWDDIVVETGISGIKDVEFIPVNEESSKSSDPLTQNKGVKLTAVNEAFTKKSCDSGNRNRQCIAFIESKGRQCVRCANDGDVYCCVHLASRFIGNSTKTEETPLIDTPMCGGTTVLGTKCKHRSLPGSSFCKKHRPRNDTELSANSLENTAKRKYEEIIPSLETTYCKEILVGDSESPLKVDQFSVMEGGASNTFLIEKLENSGDYNGTEIVHCIGSYSDNSHNSCQESAKRYSLYCDKHLPSWLKRARNGKSRIISKEVFVDLLRNCFSLDQKLRLHQACELFYKLFKSILSRRNPVPVEVQLQWALSEASKEFGVGEILMKLVSGEKERLRSIWDFNADEDAQILSSPAEESAIIPMATFDGNDDEKIKCKVCSTEFFDDQELGIHWMDNHKKEAQWLFRGYACAICLDSFTNKKILESHVQERHHVQFVEQCMLLQCIPCSSHFGNSEELWSHVLSAHLVEFRLSKVTQQQNLSAAEESSLKHGPGNSASAVNNSENLGGFRKFVCKFCGLKFDLLPDLGRHHQAAHMAPNSVSSRPQKKGIRYYAYRLKSGRLSRPRFKKGLGPTLPYRVKNRANANIKRIQTSKSLGTEGMSMQSTSGATEAVSLGRLAESQCSAVAKILFSNVQQTKPRPNNHDILSIARSACCKLSLKASLESKYGILPERLYLKAAKLCSEQNIQLQWHQEGFVCPNRCKHFKDPSLLSHLIPRPNGILCQQSNEFQAPLTNEWEVDECHIIINSIHLRENPLGETTILCNDISFGKESVPVACVVDEALLASLSIPDVSNGQNTRCSMPWESFTYITKSLLDHSEFVNECLQLGCACPYSTCSPESCDHVYLFDNDYEDAKDMYGRPMHSRFPYDDKGRIILEEGYLVYECNQMCSCNRTCQNRVLQNGIRVKLEVFKTEHKGWAVRAGEAILRGTFVCEYVGEVLDEQEANKRQSRYNQGCSYMCNIDAHINDMSRFIEGQDRYAIDATAYGNVSRFINHSCSPNLVNHQVLVESMDCQRAHIGLYASRDIAIGEELTWNYQYDLLPGVGYPCLCGTAKCRGRLC